MGITFFCYVRDIRVKHKGAIFKLPPELLEESVEEDEERGLGLCQKKSTIPTSKNK